jgi:hypothetical protein
MNPDRCAIIYSNIYDNNDNLSNGGRLISKPYQNNYYNEYHEGLLKIAKTLFNSLLNQLVNMTMLQPMQKDNGRYCFILVKKIIIP